MKIIIKLLVVFIVLASVNSIYALDEKEIDALVELGSGVTRIKKDENGNLKSLIIIGQSRISRTLGVTKGKEIAKERAKANAQAEFVKWMKSNVRTIRKQGDAMQIVIKGDDSSLSESGTAVETDEKQIESFSEGMIRGLEVIAAKTKDEGKDGVFTIIYGWTRGHANLAGSAEQANNNPDISQKTSVGSGTTTTNSGTTQTPTGGAPDTRPIGDKTSVSPSANDF